MTAAEPSVKRKSKLTRWSILLSPVLLLLVLFAWGLSSPAGSSPDDDFHIASTWCAYGERPGLCETTDDPEERLVPASMGQMVCFAFSPTVSGQCQAGLTEEASSDMITVAHGNWNGHTYPPLFYGLFGIFASQNLAVSIIAIRFVNALIVTAALTATMIALPRSIRPALGMSVAIASVPLGLSLLPSTNPSSWALTSAAMVFPTVLAIGRTSGPRRAALIALAVFGTVLGAGARADAAAYAMLAALLAWFLSNWRDRATIFTVAGIFVASIAFYLSAGQSDGLSGLSTDAETESAGLSLLVFNFLQLPALWLGMFTRLGWLDTEISPIAIFAVVLAALGVFFTAFSSLTWRKGIALCAAVGALALLPLYVLFTSNASVGAQVQPRYVLPLLIIVLAVAMVSEHGKVPQFSTPQVWLLAGLLAGAQAIALYDQLTRYIAGERILNIDAGEWWWGGSPISPMMTLAIGSLAFAGLIAVLARSFLKYQRAESDTISIDSAAAPHALSR